MQAIYFDGWKPGRRNYAGAWKAELEYFERTGKPVTPKQQRHHLSWNREDGRSSNITIAEDQKEHENWHRQMINYVTDSFESGLLKFDKQLRKYFVDEPLLVDKIIKSRKRRHSNLHEAA